MAQLALLSTMAPGVESRLPAPMLEDDMTAMEARSSGTGAHSAASSGGWLPDKPNPFETFKPTTTPSPPPASKGLSGEASLIYWWFGILLAVYVLCAIIVVLQTVELFKMFNASHILASRTAYLSSKRKINLSDFTPSEQKVVPIHASPSKPG